MFRFHSFYKLLDMICTESDIIPHLQDKTTLREERNSSWDRTSQPVDKARDAKTFQNQFRMEVAAIMFEFLLSITLFVSCTTEHITRSRTGTVQYIERGGDQEQCQTSWQ